MATLWTPKPTQQKFIDAIRTAGSQTIQAYVGAFGSGKTFGVCLATVGLCYEYPGIKILLGRFNATDLRDTTQATFFELINGIEERVRQMFPDEEPDDLPEVGIFHKSVNEFEFSNKSTVLFRTLEDAERKYKSLNIGAFGIDEASEVSEGAILMLLSRCRNIGFPNVGYLASNPTGVNHWLYDWFVRNVRSGYNLFRTNTLENVDNLPVGYVDKLRERYNEDWVNRYLLGEWGGLDEGLPVFPSFDQRIHVVDREYDRKRRILIGIDYGFQNPGVVWGQIDKDQRLVILKTWLPHSLDTFKLCEGILKRNESWFPNCVPAYFVGHDGNKKYSASQEGPTRTDNEILISYGMRPRYKYHYIERGFTTLRNLLKVRDDGLPALLVHSNNTTLIEALGGGYRYAKNREDKVEKTGIYDPIVDALRYLAVNCFASSGDAPRQEKIHVFSDFQRKSAGFPRVVLS